MDSNGAGNPQRTDEAWPHAMEWTSGLHVLVNETIWRCDGMRAGRLYNRMLFDTRAEADAFVAKMRDAAPDQVFNVEAIKASTIWN